MKVIYCRTAQLPSAAWTPLLLARNVQVQLNHNAIANQIVSLPRIDYSKVFSIDRKLRVDSHVIRSHSYGRRKRNRLFYSMQIKIAGHVKGLRPATRLNLRGHESCFGKLSYVEKVWRLQVTG